MSDLTFEKRQNLQMQEQCKRELTGLPRGTPYITKQNSQQYLSLVYLDENSKRVHKYIGNLVKDSAVVSAVQEQIGRRKYLEKQLKRLEKDLEAIDKILKIANKRIQEMRAPEQTEEKTTDQLNTRGKIQRNKESLR